MADLRERKDAVLDRQRLVRLRRRRQHREVLAVVLVVLGIVATYSAFIWGFAGLFGLPFWQTFVVAPVVIVLVLLLVA